MVLKNTKMDDTVKGLSEAVEETREYRVLDSSKLRGHNN